MFLLLKGLSMENTVPEKSTSWAPNEAPVGRWIGFFFAMVGAMIVAQVPFGVVGAFWKMDGVWAWLPNTLCTFLSFALSLVFAVILLRAIVKTTFHDFILGADGKVDWKLCGKILAAWFIGLVLNVAVSTFVFPGSEGGMELNTIGLAPIVVNLIIAIIFVWAQTTFEEVMFRCTFLRATCGNAIRPTVKCIVWGIVASLMFMGMHGANPEVLSQMSAETVVLALSSYFIFAITAYAADIVYRNCMPGCVIHWINNFFLFVFVTGSGTALETGSIFTVSGSSDAMGSLIGTIILYVPLYILMIHDARKRKAAIK